LGASKSNTREECQQTSWSTEMVSVTPCVTKSLPTKFLNSKLLSKNFTTKLLSSQQYQLSWSTSASLNAFSLKMASDLKTLLQAALLISSSLKMTARIPMELLTSTWHPQTLLKGVSYLLIST
jgi:hypothetical protein